MKNISQKLILLFCVVLLTTHFSWSQNIVITSYNCTGTGTANLALSTTGVTTYSWKVAGTTAIIASTPTTIQQIGRAHV